MNSSDPGPSVDPNQGPPSDSNLVPATVTEDAEKQITPILQKSSGRHGDIDTHAAHEIGCRAKFEDTSTGVTLSRNRYCLWLSRGHLDDVAVIDVGVRK